MGLSDWVAKRTAAHAAHDAYLRVVEQARRPAFYRSAGVPDTVDGRFDMIVLHLFLLLHRLKGPADAREKFCQALYDDMFGDMDRSLREMGVGDLGVGKQVKRMVQGFHGRVAAYDAGLASGERELRKAIRRNLFGTVAPEPDQIAMMADYLRREVANLAEQSSADLIAGHVAFGSPPGS